MNDSAANVTAQVTAYSYSAQNDAGYVGKPTTIDGTDGRDEITLEWHADGSMTVYINGEKAQWLNPDQARNVAVNGFGGEDQITIIGETPEGANLVIDGGDDADYIVGSSGREVIIGAGGDDVVVSNGGPDQVYGGPGEDTLYARSNSPESDRSSGNAGGGTESTSGGSPGGSAGGTEGSSSADSDYADMVMSGVEFSQDRAGEREGKEGSGGSGSKNWLVAIAESMAKISSNLLTDAMTQLSVMEANSSGTFDSSATAEGTEDGAQGGTTGGETEAQQETRRNNFVQAQARFQAYMQLFQMNMSSTATVLKGIGESGKEMARRN